jgi:hypothetical protein
MIVIRIASQQPQLRPLHIQTREQVVNSKLMSFILVQEMDLEDRINNSNLPLGQLLFQTLKT